MCVCVCVCVVCECGVCVCVCVCQCVHCTVHKVRSLVHLLRELSDPVGSADPPDRECLSLHHLLTGAGLPANIHNTS